MSGIQISKSAGLIACSKGIPDMELINAQSKKKLLPEDVYVFSLKVCDNDIDRDLERFSDGALSQMSELIVGKSGLFDHKWLASGQTARVFKSEVICEPSVLTSDGRTYKYVRASAYILKIAKNEDLIAEIEGGILKETSVGCHALKIKCSVCGRVRGDKPCGHVKGTAYDGKVCHTDRKSTRLNSSH